MAPLQGRPYCWAHDPAKAKERAEARRKGGFNRRREKVAQVVPEDLQLRDVDTVLDLLEIAAVDTLALENSISRSRALAYLAGQALKALEVGDMEERIGNLEAQLQQLLR